MQGRHSSWWLQWQIRPDLAHHHYCVPDRVHLRSQGVVAWQAISKLNCRAMAEH